MNLQLDFYENQRKAPRKDHGGDIRKGLRKQRRPLDPHSAVHIVLRSDRARGAWSMLQGRNERYVGHEIRRLSRSCGVRVYQYANAGNHLHLLVGFKNRAGFQRYLRTLTGLLARRITGAKKGNPIGKFWEKLAFSRIVCFGNDFRGVRDYLDLNDRETQGVSSRYNDPRRRKSKARAGPPG